jgi:hypothetical protein
LAYSYVFYESLSYGPAVAQAQESVQKAGNDQQKSEQAKSDLADALARFNPRVGTWTTALAGLVGTVVATMFGQELAKVQSQASGAQAAGFAGQAGEAGKNLALKLNTWRDKMSTAYLVVYVVFAFIAILIWIVAPYTVDAVVNLGTIAGTLLLAVARTAF